jgi:hypothetical protein
MTVTVLPDRLAALDTLTLDHGSHDDFNSGHCAMEVVAWLAGLGHTDAPDCASPVLRTFTIGLNDQWDADTRQRLRPYLPRMVGTAGDGLDETRSYMALDWLIRTYTPAWLDLAGLTAEATALRDLRRIVDLVAAQEAGPVVRAAGGKARAAWVAARVAARVAAWDAAWVAAWVAAGVAARVAAWEALKPTVETLQASALDLLDSMITGVWDA